MSKLLKTTEILSQWIGDKLDENGISHYYASKNLEEVYGKKIHTHISNFIEFAIQNNLEEDDIKITLIHDLSGALNNDKMLIPRVSSY